MHENCSYQSSGSTGSRPKVIKPVVAHINKLAPRRPLLQHFPQQRDIRTGVRNLRTYVAEQGWDLIGPAADMGGDFLVVDMGNHDLTHQIG